MITLIESRRRWRTHEHEPRRQCSETRPGGRVGFDIDLHQRNRPSNQGQRSCGSKRTSNPAVLPERSGSSPQTLLRRSYHQVWNGRQSGRAVDQSLSKGRTGRVGRNLDIICRRWNRRSRRQSDGRRCVVQWSRIISAPTFFMDSLYFS